MLDGRPLSEQGYSDLKAFLEQQVGEGLTLDYKRELTDSPRNRGELCRDVSALANSWGGTIVYGVDEQGSDRTPVLPPHGTARRLSNQAVEEWAAQVLRDGVQPRIEVEMGTFAMQETPDKCLLVVRTPASPLAPHMVTLKGDNRYYGRFYRRSNYENRIAEEYEVREMLERARRLYLGVEEDLARRGYSEPSSSDFGDNPYTRRLADDRRDDEAGNRLPAEMWASIVLLPTIPASVRQDQREWLSWLDPSERQYEPSPGSTLLPYGSKRPVLKGVVCLQPHRWGGAADLDEYLVLGFDGSVEFGFVPAICDLERRGELVRYFRGVTLLYRLWWLLNFAAEIRARLGVVASHLLVVNLRGTGGAALGGFAKGWVSPMEEMGHFANVSKCLDPNVQIRRELTAADFGEIQAATAATPPPQIRELAEDLCSAFGVVEPVLFSRAQ
jgi:hypothetical protein